METGFESQIEDGRRPEETEADSDRMGRIGILIGLAIGSGAVMVSMGTPNMPICVALLGLGLLIGAVGRGIAEAIRSLGRDGGDR